MSDKMPLPLFDTLEHLQKGGLSATAHRFLFAEHDFTQTRAFLLSYNGSEATFNAYRREVERLLQWAWLIAEKSIKDIRRADHRFQFIPIMISTAIRSSL